MERNNFKKEKRMNKKDVEILRCILLRFQIKKTCYNAKDSILSRDPKTRALYEAKITVA